MKMKWNSSGEGLVFSGTIIIRIISQSSLSWSNIRTTPVTVLSVVRLSMYKFFIHIYGSQPQNKILRASSPICQFASFLEGRDYQPDEIKLFRIFN